MEIIIFSVIGLRVISVVERPLRGWRLGLVLAMAAILALGFWWPSTREFFAADWPASWAVVGVTAAWCVFAWFWVGLGKIIGDRLPFWREKAQTAERYAADSE